MYLPTYSKKMKRRKEKERDRNMYSYIANILYSLFNLNVFTRLIITWINVQFFQNVHLNPWIPTPLGKKIQNPHQTMRNLHVPIAGSCQIKHFLPFGPKRFTSLTMKQTVIIYAITVILFISIVWKKYIDLHFSTLFFLDWCHHIYMGNPQKS